MNFTGGIRYGDQWSKDVCKSVAGRGVDTLFAYPGGTAIDLFDALYDAEGIDMILPRHEQALVHAKQMDMHVQQEELECVW